MFVITFAMEADKRVALEDGPWHLFQDLMILKETNPMMSMADVDFSDITMWIQFHNVPMACMEPDILRRIGEKVGKVEEIDTGEGGINIGRAIRIRITRKLEKPLVRRVPINQEQHGKETLVIIQYEKLPHFCFLCGRIGHIQKDCEEVRGEAEGPCLDNRLRAENLNTARIPRSMGTASASGGDDHKGLELDLKGASGGEGVKAGEGDESGLGSGESRDRGRKEEREDSEEESVDSDRVAFEGEGGR